MTKVFWTDPALEDLEEIHRHISKDSTIYANAIISEIIESVDRLEHFPDLGRQVPDYDDLTKEIITGRYRIIYDHINDRVHILSVIHTSRHFPEV